MKNTNQVADALNRCKVNPCDPVCKGCAYKGQQSCIEELHSDALVCLMSLSARIIVLEETPQWKENYAGPKN